MKNWVWVVLAVVLSGCTTHGVIDRQIKNGVFTFTPSNNTEYDFDVKLERIWDINWSVANKEDRLMIIKQMLGSSCASPKIVDENYISRGESYGVEAGTYFIKVTCQ